MATIRDIRVNQENVFDVGVKVRTPFGSEGKRGEYNNNEREQHLTVRFYLRKLLFLVTPANFRFRYVIAMHYLRILNESSKNEALMIAQGTNLPNK
jgi:hypothetical protein